MFKFEIICKPCHRCKLLEERLRVIMRVLAEINHAKLDYTITMNSDVRAADKHGFGLNQLPVLIINGNVEFVGHIKEESLIRAKIESILKHY